MYFWIGFCGYGYLNVRLLIAIKYLLSGTAFSTYAVPAIVRAAWRAVSLAQRKPPEQLTPHPPQEAPDLEEHVERPALLLLVFHHFLSLCKPEEQFD